MSPYLYDREKKNADDEADGDHFTFHYNKLTFSKRKRGRLFYELDQEVTQKMINKLLSSLQVILLLKWLMNLILKI